MANEKENKSVTVSNLGEALKSPRSKRIALWLLGIVVVFGLFGFFAAPPLAKSLLVKELSTQLHREVSIDRIEINPFALTAKVNGVSVKSQAGGEQIGFDELFVNLSGSSLFKAAAVVDEIRLQGLRLAVAHVGEGRYDISDLLDEWMKPKTEPDSGLPRFSLNNIQLIGGQITFDDQPVGKKHTVSDIHFGIPFISSLPYYTEINVQPSFSATVNGAPLSLKGDSRPFSETRESTLNIDLDRFDLGALGGYLPSTLPIGLRSAVLDSELRVVFKEVSDQVFSLMLDGAAHLSGVALSERSGEPLLAWKRLDVELDSSDLVNLKLAVRRIALDGLDLGLRVNRRGEFNVLQIADALAGPPKPAAPAKAEAAAAPAAKSPEWSIGGFVLSNGLVRWRDESNPVTTAGEVRDLLVKVGAIDSKLQAPIVIAEAAYSVDLGERFKVAKMQGRDIRVDLPAHRVDIGEVVNTQSRIRMVRNKKGQVEWIASPVFKTIRAADAKDEDSRPWLGRVAKLTVEDLGFRFEDQATQPAAVQQIDGLNLQAENLGNEPGKKGNVRLQSKVNSRGSLSIAGTVQLLPLDLALKVETQAIPLLPLQPYFSNYVNVALNRGQVSNMGEASARMEKGTLKAAYKGSLTVGDLLAVDKQNNTDFLKWKSLYIGNIDFRLDPMAVSVGEVALADFFSRLVLSPEGRLNVQDIVRRSEPTATAAATPAPTSSASAASKAPATPASPPLPIKIAKITLQNGNVNFTDLFVKPNYNVNLTKLGGRVTNLSSAADTVADLEIRGSYANTAPVQILAKLNPLAAKAFLDLKADITGVDLVGFSPYSGKYAGYDIEKGKLSLNVAYKLENNQLSAENRLFIDQFTFGNKVDSPDATKLPVNLAISLLKNNRGEIDLNLPISGSLDDPQFSIGGLIVKVIVNLFVKAVTSPFALLGSLVGGGEELSNVEFAAGRASLDAGANSKLELLAKAMNERNALKLEISGRADPEADKEGIKRVAMERAMQVEKLKDVMKKGEEGNSVETIVIAPDEYKTYLTRAYRAAKFPKPRNVVGMQKELPVEEMEKLMLTNLPASDEDVRQLARQRAEYVQSWLVDNGKVPLERLFLLPPVTETDGKGKASRVDFSLR